jgi:plastocyanin
MANIVIEINPIGNPTKDQTAEFAPSPQPVQVGDIIIWRNNDEGAKHQPKPPDGGDDDWVRLIARALNGQPATSTRFGFQEVPDPSEVQYVCALHANEKGTLNVS